MEHAVDTVGSPAGTNEKVSQEHRSPKHKTFAAKANSESEILVDKNFINLQDCLALSIFFQNPNYRVRISVGIYSGTQRTGTTLLDPGAVSNLLISSFLRRNWRSHVGLAKALPLRNATKQAVPIQGFISLHVYMRDLNDRT